MNFLKLLDEHIEEYQDDVLIGNKTDLGKYFKNPIFIFGASTVGSVIFKYIIDKTGIAPVGFIDNDVKKQGTIFEHLPVHSLEQVIFNNDVENITIINSSVAFLSEIYQQLKKSGVPENSLLDVYDLVLFFEKKLSNSKKTFSECIEDIFAMKEYTSFRQLFPNNAFLTIPSRSFILENIDNIEIVYNLLGDEESKEVFAKRIYALGNKHLTFWDSCNILKNSVSDDKQYFAQKIININDKETFIDAGTYNGGDIIEFVKRCKGQYSNIVAFEPDPVNYKNTKENLQKYDLHNFILLSKALFDKTGKVSFNAGYNFGAGISVNGEYEVDTVKLDDCIAEAGVCDPSFIKMDIEGAEKEALLGARNIIKKSKPKLAISIYHKEEDLFAIPLLIKKMNPDYKMYMRAHTFYFELLCYAV